MTTSLFRNYKPVSLFIIGFLVLADVFGTETDPAIKFIENKKQWPGNIHFSAQVPGGGNIVVGPGFFRYHVADGERLRALHERSHERSVPDAAADWSVREHAVQVNFIGANKNA